jgi:hypothetical protein
VFSNVSARWRRRLRAAVAVWAVLLVALAFAASRATVREQVDAAASREAMDAVLGEAAGSLTGAAVLAAGPLHAEPCDVTPVRPGLMLERTLQVSGATKAQVDALVERFAMRVLTEGAEEASWSGEAEGYIGLRVNASGSDPAGGRWSEPVAVQAVTGCRPLDGAVASFTPEPPPEAEAAWEFGSFDCPGGGTLESWTEPVEAQPMRVHETTGGCA